MDHRLQKSFTVKAIELPTNNGHEWAFAWA